MKEEGGRRMEVDVVLGTTPLLLPSVEVFRVSQVNEWLIVGNPGPYDASGPV